MAVPPILAAIGKKVAVDVFTDPGESIKKYSTAAVMIILFLIVVIAFPVIMVSSIPSVMMNKEGKLDKQQIKTLELYQKVADDYKEELDEWAEKLAKKNEKYYDKVILRCNFNLRWKHLVALDTIIRNQDFNNVKYADIKDLAKKLLVQKMYTEEHESLEKDKKGKYKSVTKIYLIIDYHFKSFDEAMELLGFNETDKAVAQNVISTLDGLYYDLEIDEDEKLLMYGGNSASMPYYNQGDKRWGNSMYGDTTIRATGCGPTSLAMVVSGLTGKKVYPDEMSQWAYKNGYKLKGGGSYWSLMDAGAKKWGLKVTVISKFDSNAIIKALCEGKPAIAIMGKGAFTTSGHFIVLKGVTSDGKILVYDPWKEANNDKAWDLSLIVSQSKNAFWFYSV